MPDKILHRTSKFFGQFSFGKTHLFVKSSCGKSFRYTFPIGGEGDGLALLHLWQHKAEQFLCDVLSAVSRVNRQKAKHTVFFGKQENADDFAAMLSCCLAAMSPC